MRYLSICSGIEAATVAWHPLGWTPVGYAEIDRFPSAVLAHHYPSVPNYGDFTTIKESDVGAIDLLVGGTPCQSFSIAGLRGGLADGRGNLALEYLRLADRTRPTWLVWENVPGVLSSDGGRDFGAILGGMVELGYGFAYRVLDAQYIRVDGFARAVPQRRRRVFVVGCLGDWRRAAAVLFERESLSGNLAPRRQARQAATHDVAPSLVSSGRGVERGGDTRGQDPVIGVARRDTARNTRIDWETETFVAHALRADGFDASEDGTGRGTPIIAFSSKDHGGDAATGYAPTLRAMGHKDSHANAGGQLAIAFDTTQITSAENRCNPQPGDPCHPIPAHGHAPSLAYSVCMGSDPIFDEELAMPLTRRNGDPGTVSQGWRVRRLMPVECERLQGFPDGYTAIPDRGRQAADGPRYKALGNSMAVNCMRWIGRRIEAVSAIRCAA